MPLRLLNLLLFLFLCTMGQAQFVPVTRYTTKDGMLTERIICMTQDAKGFMWFGTYFGIMRYDGYKWKKIEMPEQMKNKIVHCIRAVGEKVYAGVGFNGGFVVINKGRAENIALPKPFTEVTHITVNKDSSISVVVYEGVGQSKAVLKYSNEAFTMLWKPDKQFRNITAVASDQQQRTWIGTEKGLLVVQNNKVLQLIRNTVIESISQNENGSMVVISVDGPKSFARYFNTENLRLKSTVITKDIGVFPQFENNKSGSWGIKENNLIRIEENGNINNYTFTLPLRTVTGPIFVDREKNIWFATEAGLYKFANLTTQSFYFEEKGPTSTQILPVDSKKIITNGFALYELGAGAGQKLKKKLLIKDAGSFLFQDSKKNIWFAAWAGRGRTTVYNYINGNIVAANFFETTSSGFIEDKLWNIWASGTGITIFKNTKILQHLPIDFLDEKKPLLINMYLDEAEKIIWAGTTSWGLLKLKYFVDADGRYSLQLLDRIDQGKGLKDHTIRGNIIKDSKGRIWFGTRNSGVGYITEKKGKYEIKSFSEKEGISCSRINWISEHKGFIWVAACDGVYQLNDSKVVRKYNTGDGLIEDYVLHVVFEADTMWVGTSEGINKLLLTEQRTIVPPAVALSDITVLGHSDTALYNEGVTFFKAHQNSIGFTFTGNSYFDEKKILYKYRLNGYDEDWSEPTTGNNINYASLPPGSYRFEVHAQNARGTWSKTPAIFTFDIIQPFYRTIWFYLSMAIIVIISILLLRNYRIREKYRLEKVRSTIARDLHDDIGSALGSINILSKTAQRRLKGDKNAEQVVNKIGITAQKTLESMDEIIWTINPVKEKAIDLAIRMHNFAQPLLEAESIEFSFLSNLKDLHKLDMNLKRNFYLIFKEIIYNAIKHAQCTKVDVHLYMQNKLLVLEVKDDGIGISNSGDEERNGLKNIQARADAINGKFIINSANGKGTQSIVKAATG